MFDPLSSIPLWGMALFYAAVGAVIGVVQARRGHSRPVGFALLLTIAMVAAGASAARWDWNTRTTPLGGPADTEDRFRLEALGMAHRYTESRRRWIAMSDAERWMWRLTKFGVVSASLLSGGVPTLLWMTRRADRGSARTGKSPAG
jgi:hypothetical protein